MPLISWHMGSTADGSVAVGVGLGKVVEVFVSVSDGEMVGDVVAVASGVAATPQPTIARDVRSTKVVLRSELIPKKTFSFC